jgi:predicted nucleic acid-binding protein
MNFDRPIVIDTGVLISAAIRPQSVPALALALTVNAELILASDPHLTQMHPWRSIPILPPAAFLVRQRSGVTALHLRN